VILGALIGFVVWFGIVMTITILCICFGSPVPVFNSTSFMKALGFAAVGALIGHLI